jgi:membrane fusion protein (multidrug efflux system)
VAGKVVTTLVERGQSVKAGQLLITLDSRSAALSARAARAQSETARTQAELAKAECERGQKLYDAKSITETDYLRRMMECRSTTSSLEAASAQSDAASKLLADTSIRAPFAGVVGERFVEVGQYVRAESSVISLYKVETLRLELTVPEAELAQVHNGLSIEFTVAAYGNATFTGVIDRVSPQVRPSSRDLVVEAVIDNADRRLHPGMFASARLRVGEEKRPAVPVNAVRKQGNDARLFVVHDGKVEERIVRIAEERDGWAALFEGAVAGDKVVVDPAAELRDGMAVTLDGVVPAKASTVQKEDIAAAPSAASPVAR